jgi:hypothetical protein
VLNNGAKLGVGDETALLGAGAFHVGQRGLLLFGCQREAELLGFDGDAVEAALFAEDDGARGADQVRGEWLDGFGDVKLAGDRAAFAHEQIFSHHGLPRLKLVTGSTPDQRGYIATSGWQAGREYPLGGPEEAVGAG